MSAAIICLVCVPLAFGFWELGDLSYSKNVLCCSSPSGLMIGFSPTELVTREGKSATAHVSIMSPADVDVSVTRAVVQAGGWESIYCLW